MRYFLALLCFLNITTLFGEKIGDVEFKLPKNTREWEVGNQLVNGKGTTVLYIPNDASIDNTKELFGVNVNVLPVDLHDITSLQMGLTKMFPNMLIDLWLLDITDNSILYEWAAKDNGQEKIHGLGRAFSTKEGTIVLGYHTEKMNEIAKARAIWLPVLKAARIKG